MKKNFLFFVFFFSAAMLFAESHVNSFVEGGSWFVIHDNFSYIEETYTIHGDTTICDHECLKMWKIQNGEPERFVTHLYTENDKVYFVKSDEFHLLYDFGLSVGDTTRVDMLNSSMYENNTERYIACEGFSELDNNGRQLEVMQVTEYAYGNDKYYQDGELLSKDEWIVGIGSVYEPFFNMCYDGISGVRPKVIKVTVGNEVLYDVSDTLVHIAKPERAESLEVITYRLDGTPSHNTSNGLTIRNGKIEFRR